MHGQHQVKHRHGLMHKTPRPIGHAVPQAQHQHQQHGIKRPLAKIFGKIAHHLQQAGKFFFRHPPFAAHQRLEDIAHHLLRQPMHHGAADGQNAGPFVQAIHPIQPTQRAFKPGRPGGQKHRQRHQTN